MVNKSVAEYLPRLVIRFHSLVLSLSFSLSHSLCLPLSLSLARSLARALSLSLFSRIFSTPTFSQPVSDVQEDVSLL